MYASRILDSPSVEFVDAAWNQNRSPTGLFDVSAAAWNQNPMPLELVEEIPSTSVSPTDCEEPWEMAESPKICAVCGDKACGRNYEVASCYGCKSFFRRTLQRQKKFTCKNESQCKTSISKAVRLRCRACRFDRCVELGMNPLAVNAVKDKDTNKLVHDVLRRQRQMAQTAASYELVPIKKPIECKFERLIEEMIHLDDAHQRLRRSTFNPTPNKAVDVEWCLVGPSKMGINYGDMPVPYPPHPLYGRFLPMQIRVRDRIPYEGKPDDLPLSFKKWVMVDQIYAIEWLKTFSFFQCLEEKEKVQLVKNVTQRLSILTAAFYSYEVRGSDCTVMPDGQILFEGELPREATIERANYFEIIARFKTIGMDKKEYVLLKAIMACDPDHDCFCPQSRRSLQDQRELFTKSLASYVIASRGPMKGPYALTQMLALLAWQQQAVRKHKDTYTLVLALNLGGPWIPQILVEVLT